MVHTKLAYEDVVKQVLCAKATLKEILIMSELGTRKNEFRMLCLNHACIYLVS